MYGQQACCLLVRDRSLRSSLHREPRHAGLFFAEDEKFRPETRGSLAILKRPVEVWAPFQDLPRNAMNANRLMLNADCSLKNTHTLTCSGQRNNKGAVSAIKFPATPPVKESGAGHAITAGKRTTRRLDF